MDSKRKRCLLVAGITGAFGVLSGYAVFFAFREKASHDENWWGVLLALAVAAIVSSLTEWLRELIRYGDEERKDGKHPAMRAIGTVAVLGVFELFITGFHASAEMDRADFAGAANAVLGQSGSAVTNWEICVTAGIWVIVGTALSMMLSLAIPGEGDGVRKEMLRSIGYGGGAGLLGAPLVLLAYLLIARAITAIPYTTHYYSDWVRTVGWLQHLRFMPPASGIFQMIYLPTYVLGATAGNVWAFLGFAVVWVAITALVLRDTDVPGWVRFLFLLGTILGVVIPLAGGFISTILGLFEWANLKTVLSLLLLAVVTWGIPGVLLGCLVPLLRRPSRQNRKWGLVGYAAALLLGSATLLSRLDSSSGALGNDGAWPYLIAAIAFLTGVLFQLGAPVEEYWPLAALSVAIGICGAMSILQEATFAGVVKNIHMVDQVQPKELTAALRNYQGALQGFGKDSQLEREERRASPSAEAIATLGRWPVLTMPTASPQPGNALYPFPLSVRKKALIRPYQAPQQPWQIGKGLDLKSLQIPSPAHGEWSDELAKLDLHAVTPPLSPPAAAERSLPQPKPSESPRPLLEKKIIGATSPNTGGTEETPRLESGPKEEPSSENAARALEISITGSFGFWTTVGLLACWKILDEDKDEVSPLER